MNAMLKINEISPTPSNSQNGTKLRNNAFGGTWSMIILATTYSQKSKL
jgi:hypothetical protein